jgi:membrane protease YdiL (CAAX protease family)
MRPSAAFGWTVALWVLTLLAIRLTEAARPGAAYDLVNLGACQTLAVLVVVFVILRVYTPDGSVRAALGLRPLAWWQLVLSAGLGAGLYPSLAMIERALIERFPYEADELAQLEKLDTLHSTSHRLVFIAIAFGILPLTREIFFRGMLFEQLARAAPARTAILATSVCFAFALDLRTVPTALILGLALGRLRSSTGTVLGPVVAELAFWTIPSVSVARGLEPNADIAYPTRYVVVGAVAALLALILVGWRGGTGRHE